MQGSKQDGRLRPKGWDMEGFVRPARKHVWSPLDRSICSVLFRHHFALQAAACCCDGSTMLAHDAVHVLAHVGDMWVSMASADLRYKLQFLTALRHALDVSRSTPTVNV